MGIDFLIRQPPKPERAGNSTGAPPSPASPIMPLVQVRLLKDGITVGNRTHTAGDVVQVPDRRADTMFRFREAAPIVDAAPIEQATATPRSQERATAPRQAAR